jgi:hypothetical protein
MTTWTVYTLFNTLKLLKITSLFLPLLFTLQTGYKNGATQQGPEDLVS